MFSHSIMLSLFRIIRIRAKRSATQVKNSLMKIAIMNTNQIQNSINKNSITMGIQHHRIKISLGEKLKRFKKFTNNDHLPKKQKQSMLRMLQTLLSMRQLKMTTRILTSNSKNTISLRVSRTFVCTAIIWQEMEEEEHVAIIATIRVRSIFISTVILMTKFKMRIMTLG